MKRYASVLIGGATEATELAESHRGEVDERHAKYASKIGEATRTAMGQKVECGAVCMAKSVRR